MSSTTARKVAAAAADRMRQGHVVIAIDGPSGSGKSTLAADLAELCDAAVVHGDDFYRPMEMEARAELGSEEGYDLYFDWQRLRGEVLRPLSAGRPARYRRYDWATGAVAPGEVHVVLPAGVVVVEGVYSARPELVAFYDLVVYVDTSPEEMLQRLHDRGHDHGPVDWPSRWRRAEAHYVAVTRPQERADLVVSGAAD